MKNVTVHTNSNFLKQEFGEMIEKLLKIGIYHLEDQVHKCPVSGPRGVVTALETSS